MRAMVVEISKSLSVLLSQHLANLQIKTITQKNGKLALAMLEQASCDLVCISMHLEDMDGVEFVTQLRKIAKQTNTYVIMLTTSENSEALSDALKAGVNEIFSKDQVNNILEHLTNWSQNTKLHTSQGHILYVEDNQATAMVVSEQLKHIGYTVEHVTRGSKALELFQQNQYDLLMVDYILEGGMSGLELIQEIRLKQSHSFETPILVLSGLEDEEKKVTLLRSGANDYLSKRASRDEMAVRVNNLVKTKRLFEQVQYQQQKLQHLAMTDQLTELHNRHYLFEAAPQKISEAQRHGFPVALLIVDLDKFKFINDTHGHATGDEVLKETGKLLKQLCRKEDIVARFGGEEFVILLSHCSQEQALSKAESIRSELQQLRPANLPVTGSFGVSTLEPGRVKNFNQLFAQADSAVYKAKNDGRNRVVFADSH